MHLDRPDQVASDLCDVFGAVVVRYDLYGIAILSPVSDNLSCELRN